jgi:dihydrofolate reductase
VTRGLRRQNAGMPEANAPLLLIAAVADGQVIGAGNRLLWRLPQDMAYFREQTLGHPVIMGRKTWESLPEKFRPLPGRPNLVVSRQSRWHAEGATVCATPEAALAQARQLPGAERVFVIGGEQIYRAFLPQADELLITHVEASYPQGDAFFPDWTQRFVLLSERRVPSDVPGQPELRFARYGLKSP